MKGDTPLFAAIPFSLIDAAGDGDITQSMLAVMVFLYRWAKWETGRVNRTSAPAIASWCQGKWSEKTIQDALLRLERQGYITRENTPGSHKTYPVVIHNYVAKVRHHVVGPDGKLERDGDGRHVTAASMELINERQTVTWAEAQQGALRRACAESSADSSADSYAEPSADSYADCSDNTTYTTRSNQENNLELQGAQGATDDDGVGRSPCNLSTTQELKARDGGPAMPVPDCPPDRLSAGPVKPSPEGPAPDKPEPAMAPSSPPKARPVPPLVAQRRSKCCACKGWVNSGEEIRGVSDGSGGMSYAHRYCAPTLDDIREVIGSGSRKVGGTPFLMPMPGSEANILCRNPDAVAALVAEFPPNIFFEEGWRPLLPDLPGSRFRREEEWLEEQRQEEGEQAAGERGCGPAQDGCPAGAACSPPGSPAMPQEAQAPPPEEPRRSAKEREFDEEPVREHGECADGSLEEHTPVGETETNETVEDDRKPIATPGAVEMYGGENGDPPIPRPSSPPEPPKPKLPEPYDPWTDKSLYMAFMQQEVPGIKDTEALKRLWFQLAKTTFRQKFEDFLARSQTRVDMALDAHVVATGEPERTESPG
jgi:hypothetical protein